MLVFGGVHVLVVVVVVVVVFVVFVVVVVVVVAATDPLPLYSVSLQVTSHFVAVVAKSTVTLRHGPT